MLSILHKPLNPFRRAAVRGGLPIIPNPAPEVKLPRCSGMLSKLSPRIASGAVHPTAPSLEITGECDSPLRIALRSRERGCCTDAHQGTEAAIVSRRSGRAVAVVDGLPILARPDATRSRTDHITPLRRPIGTPSAFYAPSGRPDDSLLPSPLAVGPSLSDRQDDRTGRSGPGRRGACGGAATDTNGWHRRPEPRPPAAISLEDRGRTTEDRGQRTDSRGQKGLFGVGVVQQSKPTGGCCPDSPSYCRSDHPR